MFHHLSKVAPIAIYDSGVRGLAVARAIQKILPQEHLHYIGDTQHLPYGEKTEEQLRGYLIRVVNFCLDQGYKLLVIACNTATAVADAFLSSYLRACHKTLGIVNVIDPLVNHIITTDTYRHIGVISTTYTVASGIYERRCKGGDVSLFSLATPELAPMLEASFAGRAINPIWLNHYLSQLCSHTIEAIIPACTHYLFLKQAFQAWLMDHYQTKIDIMDVERLTAVAVKDFLTTHELINDRAEKAVHCFMATRLTLAFQAASKQLFDYTPINI